MLQQILDFPLNSNDQDLSLKEQCLLESLDKYHITDVFSPIFQHSLENLSKDTVLQQKSKYDSSPKIVKEKKKRIRKYISNNPNNKKGHWSHEENLKYHYFLELHALQFIEDEKRKTDKVFKSMAGFIGTREPHQCRSHHQKVEKKWGEFWNILVNLRVQNFKKVDSGPLIRQLEKLGLQNSNILSETQLMSEEKLYKNILNLPAKQNTLIEDPTTQQLKDFINEDNQSRCHKKNCMCLMMSEAYEDQLEI